MSICSWVLDLLDTTQTVVSRSLILWDVLDERPVDVRDAIDCLSMLLIESPGVMSWGAPLFLSLAVWECVHLAWEGALHVSLCSG